MSISLTREDFEKACQEFISHWNDHDHRLPSKKSSSSDWESLGGDHYCRRWSREVHPMNPRLGYLVSEPFDRILRKGESILIPSTNDDHRLSITPTEDRIIRPFESSDPLLVSGDLVGGNIPDEDDDDESTMKESRGERTIFRLRCCVIYSDTYRVPQLLFDAYHSDGRPLTLEELLRSDTFIRQQSISVRSDQIEYPFNTLAAGNIRRPDDDDQMILPFITQIEHPYTGMPSWSIHPCRTPIVLDELIQMNNLGGDDESDLSSSSRLIIEAFLTMVSGVMNLRRSANVG